MLASERRNIPPFIETSLEILSQHEFQFDTDLVSRFQLCLHFQEFPYARK